MKQRVWELDALRGLCILGMVAVHLVYDLVELYGVVDWNYPAAFVLLKDWGGVLFLLISGICATLGTRSVRRGAIVLSCGMLCTAVTWGMYALGFSGRSIVIWFGVLHCLGVSMILWRGMRKLPWQALLAIGLSAAAAGFALRGVHVRTPLLIAFGVTPSGFSSSDYFPLLPYFGFFLLGAALGKTLYARKCTLFPRVNAENAVLRFLRACGRHSLEIYLLHQPVLSAVILGVRFLLTPR